MPLSDIGDAVRKGRSIGRGLEALGIALVPVVVFVAWYCIAADYGYRAVAGSYRTKMPNGSCTLTLKRDQTFDQLLIADGKQQHSSGTWRLFGEGGIALSENFQPLPAEESAHNQTYYGEVRKTMGLFIYLQMKPSPGGPVLRKKLL